MPVTALATVASQLAGYRRLIYRYHFSNLLLRHVTFI